MGDVFLVFFSELDIRSVIIATLRTLKCILVPYHILLILKYVTVHTQHSNVFHRLNW